MLPRRELAHPTKIMVAMMTIKGFPSSLPEAEIKGLLETIGQVSFACSPIPSPPTHICGMAACLCQAPPCDGARTSSHILGDLLA